MSSFQLWILVGPEKNNGKNWGLGKNLDNSDLSRKNQNSIFSIQIVLQMNVWIEIWFQQFEVRFKRENLN